jgi:hypothetical protein
MARAQCPEKPQAVDIVDSVPFNDIYFLRRTCQTSMGHGTSLGHAQLLKAACKWG